jgi:DNA adenine methylase
MTGGIPHIVQYQGSKRILAPRILERMPTCFDRLIEPFAGTAAITMAAASGRRAAEYHVNDINGPLADMLRSAVESPDRLIEGYRKVWSEQFEYSSHIDHYYKVREEFNRGVKTPENMLYLIARCVKGSVRYGKDGGFNQSPDKRRHGTRPDNVERDVSAISKLLKGRTTFSSVDYREILDTACRGDVVYMDPPYQGVTGQRDSRYFSRVLFDEFVESLETLNERRIGYIVSYDGACGDKKYGTDLPPHLNCEKMLLDAGTSGQSVLLGRMEKTVEALYVSPALQPPSGRRSAQQPGSCPESP